MGVSAKWGRQTSNFSSRHARQMKFSRLANIKKRLNFDKIWGYQNKRISLKQGRQNLNFN